ncbi:MAG TPA: hypothetical protein ENN13_05290 [Candidatus Altiarchaeales archaeon]|nr:hypothetical protein [Candidatus Altiarchaeales archaeon]
MSEDFEQLLKKVSGETGKSVEEIKAQMSERKEKTHGLLSDYGALYAVAKANGMDLSDKTVELTKLGDLTVLQSVSMAGRVKTIFNTREFERKDGGIGKFASLVLKDSTGEARLVLWDQNTDLVKKVNIGDIILVKNGYAKENRGFVEVHAGGLTSLSVNPKDMGDQIPEIIEEFSKISDLTDSMPDVTIVARVSRYFPAKEFERKDGGVGKRASFIAEDESGKIRTVLWDSAAEKDLKEGDIIKIAGGYTRKGLNGELELQAGGRSVISKSKAKMKLPELPKRPGLVQISDVDSNMQGVTVEAKVLKVYPPREYSGGQMASMVLGDSSGSIRLVLWSEQSHNAEKIGEGDNVRVKNAYSKANLDDEPELHLGKYGEIEVDTSLNIESVSIPKTGPAVEDKKIIDLEDGARNVRISGKIVAVEDRPLFYTTCGECGVKVQEIGGSWMCDNCGMIEPEYNMVASVIVEDESSNIRVVGFREVGEALLGTTSDAALNLVGETQDDRAPIQAARENRVGQKITVVGNTRFNDYNDTLEIIAQEVE